MNIDYIKQKIDEIASVNDSEIQHGMEDGLNEEFIDWVALNAPEEIANMAKTIMKVRDLDFSRWYA